MSIQAIETEYNGYRFRSRLEARWAVFFDALGVRYEYEKEGFHLESVSYKNPQTGYEGILVGDVYYLPDFYLPDHSTWVEIKGVVETDDAMHKCKLLQANTDKVVVIAEGEIGNHQIIDCSLSPNENNGLFLFGLDEYVGVIDLIDIDSQFNAKPLAWGDEIHCPVCNDCMIHIGDSVTNHGDDTWGSAWHGRGSAIRVECWCECGARFVFRFGFHKGSTFLAIEDICKPSNDLCLWLALGDEKRKTEAINAARSARFEHGETPKVQRGSIKKGVK